MKKKILFIVQLPPPVHGASLMNQYAFQSSLIRSEFKCAVLPLQFVDSIADIGTFGIKKLWKMLIFCCKLFYTLLTFKPHLVYFTLAPVGSAFYRDALFSFIIKCFGIKRLYHLHGKGIREEAAGSPFKKALYRFTFKNSEVVVLARSLEADVRPVFNGNIFVLPNGIPATNCIHNERVSSIPVLLYLSNLVRSKGIEIFLRSLVQLQNHNHPFIAWIVGAPYDITLEDVHHFIEQNALSDNVKVKGAIYGTEKQQLICAADVLVFPSFYKNEAFPLTLLEAMQAGLPVIATNNGAIKEMVDDAQTGFIVPQQDVPALTEKIEMLIRNPELIKEMGRKGKEKFERNFTIELFEKKLFEIFKQVLH